MTWKRGPRIFNKIRQQWQLIMWIQPIRARTLLNLRRQWLILDSLLLQLQGVKASLSIKLSGELVLRDLHGNIGSALPLLVEPFIDLFLQKWLLLFKLESRPQDPLWWWLIIGGSAVIEGTDLLFLLSKPSLELFYRLRSLWDVLTLHLG